MKLDVRVVRSMVDRLRRRRDRETREVTSRRHEDARDFADSAKSPNRTDRAGLVKTFAVISKLAQTEPKWSQLESRAREQARRIFLRSTRTRRAGLERGRRVIGREVIFKRVLARPTLGAR